MVRPREPVQVTEIREVPLEEQRVLSPIISGVIPLLVGVCKDAIVNLEVRAIASAIDDVEALASTEDRHFSVLERPLLVGVAITQLDVDGGVISGSLGSEAEVVVQARLEVRQAGEGGRLGANEGHEGGEGEERTGEHRCDEDEMGWRGRLENWICS